MLTNDYFKFRKVNQGSYKILMCLHLFHHRESVLYLNFYHNNFKLSKRTSYPVRLIQSYHKD